MILNRIFIIGLPFIYGYLDIGAKAFSSKRSILSDTFSIVNDATSFLIDGVVNSTSAAASLIRETGANADQLFNKTISSAADFQNKIKGEDVTVGFNLYTKLNPDVPQSLETHNLKSFQDSNFNSTNQIKIVIHGYTENFTNPEHTAQIVLKGFFCNGGDFNIILIDYKTNVLDNLLTDYFLIHSSGVPRKVAEKIRELIEYIKESFPDITNKKIDLIGFSLGGQISAFTAQTVSGKLNSITALDPAAPLYSFNTKENKLSKDDADYIETIHTSSLSGMFLETNGDSDIFVNFGGIQPGCSKWIGILSNVPCDHVYAAIFFARTLCEKEPFVAYECSKAELAIKICKDNPLKKKMIVGGDPLKRQSGVYNIMA